MSEAAEGAAPSRPRSAIGLRRLLGRTFGAFFALFVLLSVTVLISLLVFRSRGDAVIDRWQPAYTLSVDVLDDLVNQETGVRGFALSHQASSLQPYEEFQQLQAQHLASLRTRIAGEPELEADLAALLRAEENWRSQFAESFIARIRANDPTVDADVGGAAAKDAFDAIRAAGGKLAGDLRDVREQYKAERTDAGRVVYASLIGASLLVLASMLLIWRGLRRSVLEPIEGLAAQTRAIAGGTSGARIVPSGPREIESLGTDVNAMRERIASELARIEAARLELIARSEDLARSNADLEQFAYVASHDLSEPLRKVANFCQLLERQYGPQLDDKARQYIDFAVDGAKRMQVLISDLLAFSRVGRTTEEFAPVALQTVAARAVANLEQKIADAGARVEVGTLPTVHGDSTLLTALFQNLLGNAIKYRGDDPPLVRVSAEPDGAGWLFHVRDNGIGIDPKYADRIFAIFQRLHLRDQYGGTGIGLALCRKIVEFHGGRIWLTDEPGPGATFAFTLAAEPAVATFPTGQDQP